jgi:predicted permease
MFAICKIQNILVVKNCHPFPNITLVALPLLADEVGSRGLINHISGLAITNIAMPQARIVTSKP